MALNMELRAQIDRVRTMVRCCNERELCSGCPFEDEPECHPLATAMELIDALEEEAETAHRYVWHKYPSDPPTEHGEYLVVVTDGDEVSRDIAQYSESVCFIDGKWATINDWSPETFHVIKWAELPEEESDGPA